MTTDPLEFDSILTEAEIEAMPAGPGVHVHLPLAGLDTRPRLPNPSRVVVYAGNKPVTNCRAIWLYLCPDKTPLAFLLMPRDQAFPDQPKLSLSTETLDAELVWWRCALLSMKAR